MGKFSHTLITYFFFQAEDGIRDPLVTGVQTCALPISTPRNVRQRSIPSKPLRAKRLRRALLTFAAPPEILKLRRISFRARQRGATPRISPWSTPQETRSPARTH